MKSPTSAPQNTIALIHTVASLVTVFDRLTKQELSEWNSFNILDESLLRNTIRDGSLSKTTVRRLTQYVFSAAEAGATAIVVTCSSLGDAVDAILPLSSVPLFRIDQGMAIEGVSRAKRIGVLATLETTLVPTGNLVRATAADHKKHCQIIEKLCAGAFDLLSRGDQDGHDAMVVGGLKELASQSDLIILAQASMAKALSSPGVDLPEIPVLTSPELGIKHIRSVLSR